MKRHLKGKCVCAFLYTSYCLFQRIHKIFQTKYVCIVMGTAYKFLCRYMFIWIFRKAYVVLEMKQSRNMYSFFTEFWARDII